MPRRMQGGGFGRGGRRGMGGGYRYGPGGECVCPNCNYREPHEANMPCYNRKCPRCGAMLTRSIE
jgi:hypothetical protein